MGSGASSNSQKMLAQIEFDGFAEAFKHLDVDGDGDVDFEEFAEAARKMGISEEEGLADIFAEIDDDGSGTINREEFVRFCVSVSTKLMTRKQKPSSSIGRNMPHVRTMTLADLLTPSAAQHGFKLAHEVLRKKPAQCLNPIYRSSDACPGSPWLPLHYLLARMPRSGENARMNCAAAEPIVLHILRVFPQCATMRVMEGVRYHKGCLPLEFAVTRGWSGRVVEAVVKAYPAALRVIDPDHVLSPKAKWEPKSLKGGRWMRKIAEENMWHRASPAMLRLLPQPSKSAPFHWTSGLDVEAAEKLQAEKLARKLAAEADKENGEEKEMLMASVHSSKASSKSKRKKGGKPAKKKAQGRAGPRQRKQ